MVTIRQHGESGALFDLRDFIDDLEAIQRELDYWIVRIDDCSGPACIALSELTIAGAKLSPLAFANMCHMIYQTIDGEFVGYIGDREVVRMLAFDSSFWESSGPESFEQNMLAKYGAYQGLT